MRNKLSASLLLLAQFLHAAPVCASEKLTDEPVPTWPAIIILLVLAIGVLIVNWHSIKPKKPDHDKRRKNFHA